MKIKLQSLVVASRCPGALLNLIGNMLERIRATPGNPSLDREQAINLLSDIEDWCIRQHEDGYVIFRDPADDVVTLEP